MRAPVRSMSACTHRVTRSRFRCATTALGWIPADGDRALGSAASKSAFASWEARSTCAALLVRAPRSPSGYPSAWSTRLRVLLADDHAIVRRGLRSLIESQPELKVVAEAADGLEALRLSEEHQPDAIILDVAMPKLNGIEVAERVQKQARPPSVIILSMHADESYIIRALAAGARAYLLKDATDEDLLPAVRAVSAGKPFFSPAVTAVLVEDYVRRLQQRGLTDSYHLLTDREKEVLQLLAEGRSNKEVAVLLDLGLSTVETHRANLMQKLNLHNTAEIVLYAVRKGLIV